MNNDLGDDLQIKKHGKMHQNVGNCINIFWNVFIGRPPDLLLTLPTSKCSNWCPWLAKVFYNFHSLIPFQKSFELTWCIYKIWFSDFQIRDHLYVYLSFKSCSTLLAWRLARLCSPWSYNFITQRGQYYVEDSYSVQPCLHLYNSILLSKDSDWT